MTPARVARTSGHNACGILSLEIQVHKYVQAKFKPLKPDENIDLLQSRVNIPVRFPEWLAEMLRHSACFGVDIGTF